MKKLFLISLLIGNVAFADNYGTPAVFKCNCPTIQERYNGDGYECGKNNVILLTNRFTTPTAIIPENNPSKPIGCELIK